MNPKELRIDNIVLYEGVEMFVEEITKRSLDLAFNKGDNCAYCIVPDHTELKPIPLTEEWLLKFGFELKTELREAIKVIEEKQVYLKIDLDDLSFALYDSEVNFRGGDYPAFSMLIKSVHHLQNLYFALTGEELTIKELTNQ